MDFRNSYSIKVLSLTFALSSGEGSFSFRYTYPLGHRMFLTKNLFLAVELDQVFLSKKVYDVDGLAESSTLVRKSAVLGWYYPTSSVYY